MALGAVSRSGFVRNLAVSETGVLILPSAPPVLEVTGDCHMDVNHGFQFSSHLHVSSQGMISGVGCPQATQNARNPAPQLSVRRDFTLQY